VKLGDSRELNPTKKVVWQYQNNYK